MVEVQNLVQAYDTSWNWGWKTQKARLSERCYARLVREAREHFDGFGLDFSQYSKPSVTLCDEIVAQVEWEHITSYRKLILQNVWFDKRTGEINQCGQNYGNLVS